MKDLSIIIPSRNEKHLYRTIVDLYKNIEANTEILYEEDTVIGQRALINKLVTQSTAKYIMKVDAHCSFSQGFDKILLKDMDSRTIMAPYMLCLDEDTWTPRHSPMSSSYCFDTDLVFQYNLQAEDKELINETMCLQGSAWIVNRETYFKWNLDDPTLGSWGMQGVELGIKAWTNRGRCVTNKRCNYAHLFREKEKDFPYKRDKKAIKKTRDIFQQRFKNKDIAGLIRKFDFPSNWTEAEVNML